MQTILAYRMIRSWLQNTTFNSHVRINASSVNRLAIYKPDICCNRNTTGFIHSQASCFRVKILNDSCLTSSKLFPIYNHDDSLQTIK